MSLHFTVNKQRCTSCGLCKKVCYTNIIEIQNNYPLLSDKSRCVQCFRCMAVCPVQALSLCKINPDTLIPLKNNFPDPSALETLIKGRRSTRHFKKEPLAKEEILHLLNTASHAPTGTNARQVHFTVIHNPEKMEQLRTNILKNLAELFRQNKLTTDDKRKKKKIYYCQLALEEEAKGNPYLLRGAPHLVIATAPPDSACPYEDGLIALTYLELLLECHGYGTLWNGMVAYAYECCPSSFDFLSIPHNHVFCFALCFGKKAIQFARTVDRPSGTISLF